jgi:Sortase domain
LPAGYVERITNAGDPGTAVYAAHRDSHFAFLSEIQQRDGIVVTRQDGTTRRFRVAGMDVVRWDFSLELMQGLPDGILLLSRAGRLAVFCRGRCAMSCTPIWWSEQPFVGLARAWARKTKAAESVRQADAARNRCHP